MSWTVSDSDKHGYRADIDGLRAVAVLSVLAFHYSGPVARPLLPGGFTGVDVFFVISGFLITQRLVAEIEAGTFSLLRFYDRRIRRILPALAAMLVACLIAGRILLWPGDYMGLAASSAAAAFGASNFYFLEYTGYFDRAADLMPLLHTWSLAIEEQFYLAWPIALYLVARGRTRLDVGAILAALVVTGLIVGVVVFDADPKLAFYSPVARAWELALGGLLVFLPRLPRAAGELAAILGVSLILAGFLVCKPHNFPGMYAFYPCAGAALLIWPRQTATTAGRLLGRLAPIGLISYSLYLWHWPIWVYFRVYINGGQPSPIETGVLAVISLAVAWISYAFVEQPLRRPRLQPARTVGIGLAASAGIFIAAMYVHSAEGLPRRLLPTYAAMRNLDLMWEWPCKPTSLLQGNGQACSFGAEWDAPGRKAILWGDSNAHMLAPLFEGMAIDRGIGFALVMYCPAILDGTTTRREIEPSPGYNEGCARARETLLKVLAERPDIDTVILAGSWRAVMAGLAAEDRAALLRRSLDQTVSRLLSLNKRVVMVSTIPHWRSDQDPVSCALTNAGLPRRPCPVEHLTPASFSGAALEQFRLVAKAHPAAILIDPVELLCSAVSCVDRIDGEFIYRDGVHFRRNLTDAANRELARRLGFDHLFAD